MDRFDAMQAFVKVVETGSFTKAAEALQLSKTTVSHLVQQLEGRLRVKLLHRTTSTRERPKAISLRVCWESAC